ncbi:MAG: hypothetical protein R8K48_02630 [Gallionella sp.]
MAEWGRDTPWRQGYLLCANAIAALELARQENADQTVVIVATHDCDLAQLPEIEPYVEVIVGRKVDPLSNCKNANSARKLHIEFNGNSTFWGEFVATDMRRLNKADLNSFMPGTDMQLTIENHNIFQLWLASRYRRSAFPDEFERRLTKETKLSRKLHRQ